MNRTVILAAGDFPARGSEPERILRSAVRVIACDSAAECYRRVFHREPDVIIGDFDSLSTHPRSFTRAKIVRIADPSRNDLAKAVAYARQAGLQDLVIVGATGKREDHTIGNVFRALELGVPIESECGSFLPIGARRSFRLWKGAGVSIFVSDPRTRLTSRGLKWKLDDVVFANPYCATLNRASSANVTLTSTGPAFAYLARDPSAVRAVVSLGSNQGNRCAFLRRAIAALAKLPRTRLLDASSVIETEPLDVPPEFAHRKFLNQAAVFETTLEPLAFARAMHAIEDRLGRVRAIRNGPRTIDLDLILFGNVRLDTPELTLPHPRAKDRVFVLQPLHELGIDFNGAFKS